MRAAATLFLCLAAVPAWGQEVRLAPSPAVACLTRTGAPSDAPEYPFDEWKRGKQGRVLVQLSFTSADGPPDVEVRHSSGGEVFVDAVRAHVRTFRVPCMAPAGGSAPIRLLQEYVFRPDDRKAMSTVPIDSADQKRRELLGCIQRVGAGTAPHYPARALEIGLQARLVAILRFVGPDQVPEVSVFHGSRDARIFVPEVRRWLEGHRLPCYDGEPIEAYFALEFRIGGEPAFGFKPMSLMQYLANIKDLDKQQAAYDFSTMNCPFDVKISYYQPHMPNTVSEIGSVDAARRPFLEWLAASHLNLTPRNLDGVLGDSVVLHIPCAKLDLKPKE